MPTLLLVLLTLINQWIQEIRDCWPSFALVISYSDHIFKERMALSSLTRISMKEYSKLDAVPVRLR